jgi:hypothetical protein
MVLSHKPDITIKSELLLDFPSSPLFHIRRLDSALRIPHDSFRFRVGGSHLRPNMHRLSAGCSPINRNTPPPRVLSHNS